MMLKNRINFYNKYIKKWKLININNNFDKTKDYPTIKLTLCLFNLKKHNNINILKSIYFLENITNQRPFILKMEKNKKIKNSNSNYKIQVTLSKQNKLFFLEMFKEFTLKSILNSEFLKIKSKINNLGNYSFVLKDLTYIPGLEFTSHNWIYPLKCDYIFNNNNKFKTYLFLKEFELFLQKNEIFNN